MPGEINWSEDFSELTFIPDQLLARNNVYTLAVDSQAQARGGTTLSESRAVQYQTVPTLAVIGTDPAQGGTKRPYGGISLYFNGPVREDDILKYIAIDEIASHKGHNYLTIVMDLHNKSAR